MELATKCCQPRHCKGCGTALLPHDCWMICVDCRAKATAAKLADAPAVAEADYDGPVYDPAYDAYYLDVEALEDAYELNADHLPLRVWTCTTHPIEVTEENIEDMLSSILEDHHEDAEFDGHLWDMIKDAAATFNAAQSGQSWNQAKTALVLTHGGLAHDDDAPSGTDPWVTPEELARRMEED
jgi:hypothetical protein